MNTSTTTRQHAAALFILTACALVALALLGLVARELGALGAGAGAALAALCLPPRDVAGLA